MIYVFSKKIFTLLITGLVILPLFSSVASGQDKPTAFMFFLYLDNGRLALDKDNSLHYDIAELEYSPQNPKGEEWTGKLFDYDGKEISKFNFYPVSGKNTIYSPYSRDAVRVAFYSPSNFRVLALSVVELQDSCDFNGVCSSDLQENGLTCPNDCPWEMPVNLPAGSPESSPTAGPAPSEFSFIPFIFLTIFLIVGIIVGYIIFRTFRAQ